MGLHGLAIYVATHLMNFLNYNYRGVTYTHMWQSQVEN